MSGSGAGAGAGGLATFFTIDVGEGFPPSCRNPSFGATLSDMPNTPYI